MLRSGSRFEVSAFHGAVRSVPVGASEAATAWAEKTTANALTPKASFLIIIEWYVAKLLQQKQLLNIV